MPIIKLPYRYLEELSGIDRDTIIKEIPMIGADIERYEEEYFDVEFFPDRPDLFSAEGVSRAMRGFMGLESGLPEYSTEPSGLSFEIEPGLEDIRPYLGSAVIRGLSFNNESIECLMGLQESLHWAVGRGRVKVAIGVHDLDKVKPPFKYFASPKSRTFVPLDKDELMTLDEILEKHPKGVDYAHIVKDFDKYPLITDAEDNVLSFPPIINGELTKVTESTKNILLDCTGTDERAVMTAVKIICSALAQAGGKIESIEVNGVSMPSLAPKVRDVKLSECRELLGIDIDIIEMAQLLKKMRFGAEPVDGEILKVFVPCYRADILHDWDIFEDVAKAYGYENIDSLLPPTSTIGHENRVNRIMGTARTIMSGIGYLEMMPFTLSNDRVMYSNMQRKKPDYTLYVKHPISEEQTLVRTDILPLLMETLRNNQHRELPQRLFSTGDVIEGTGTFQKLAGVTMHTEADFSEIYAVVDLFMREADLEYRVEESEDPAFLDGRRGDIYVGDKKIGSFGEIHPQVIVNFEMAEPVAGFEIDLRVMNR
jgi:phenylalanyl-tRNA synthetase beta chain